MRRSIEELRTFYGEPAGALARRLLARRLEDAWGEAANSDVLGIGYATPWLDAFVGARRLVVTNAAGAINTSFRTGSIMLIAPPSCFLSHLQASWDGWKGGCGPQSCHAQAISLPLVAGR